jgi:hypothetical protein
VKHALFTIAELDVHIQRPVFNDLFGLVRDDLVTGDMCGVG